MKIGYRKELLENYQTYCELKNFTDGRVSKVSNYLIPYLTERGTDDKANKAFSNRVERLYNVNYCSPYLYIHLGHLAQEIVVTGADTEKFKSVVEDVNQFGEPLNIAFQYYLWNYLQDGMIGILVDKEPQPKNMSAVAAKGLRSYQELFDATCIRNYEYYTSGKNKGKFKHVYLTTGFKQEKNKFKERVLHLFLPPTGNYVWETLISDEEYRIGEIGINADLTFNQEKSGLGNFDEIPFVLLGEGATESIISEVMPLNKALMNKRSVRSNVLYNQGFQRSFIIGAKRDEIKQVGEFLVIPLANEKATVSTIPAGDVTGLTEEVRDLQNQIDRRGRLEFNQLSDDTRNQQSAESKSIDKMGKKRIYNLIIDQFQSGLTKVMRFHARFDEAANFNYSEITTTIAREFGLDDSTLEQAQYQTAYYLAKDLNATKVQKGIVKAMVAKLRFLPEKDKTEKETMQLLLDDIDNAEPVVEVGIPSEFGNSSTPTVQ